MGRDRFGRNMVRVKRLGEGEKENAERIQVIQGARKESKREERQERCCKGLRKN